MVCVFVNFVFSNTVFIHTHACIDGHSVTHSHPYLPSSHHSHSALSLDQIAGFNAAASAIEGSAATSVPAPARYFTVTAAGIVSDTAAGTPATAALRGPPQA